MQKTSIIHLKRQCTRFWRCIYMALYALKVNRNRRWHFLHYHHRFKAFVWDVAPPGRLILRNRDVDQIAQSSTSKFSKIQPGNGIGDWWFNWMTLNVQTFFTLTCRCTFSSQNRRAARSFQASIKGTALWNSCQDRWDPLVYITNCLGGRTILYLSCDAFTKDFSLLIWTRMAHR